MNRKVIIIGSGPAGLTAALYSARANLNPLVLEGNQPGGQLTITTDVENYPGFPEGIMGPELMDLFRKQAERFGAECHFKHVTKVDFSERPFKVWVGDEVFTGESVVLATGASARMLGLESEAELMGYGVSACATCDGFFYRNKAVAVVGGGNTAVEESLYLSNICSHVTVVHRRDALRAEKTLQHRLFERIEAGKVTMAWDHALEEVIGNEMGVTGINIKHVRTEEPRKLDVEGVFIAIGHVPNSGIFDGQLEMKNGYLVVNSGVTGNSTQTSIPGVFAAGDIADQIYRQAVTSAGFGCMAALDAEKFLDS